jgi:prevent-host-death family protein
MHKIDVAEASLRSAELLRRVHAGEEVLLTDKNQPVARLVRPRRPVAGRSSEPREAC